MNINIWYSEILVKDIRKKKQLTVCKPTIIVNLIHIDKTYWYLYIIFVDNVFCSVVTMLLECSLCSCTCRHATHYLSHIRMICDTYIVLPTQTTGDYLFWYSWHMLSPKSIYCCRRRFVPKCVAYLRYRALLCLECIEIES